MRGPSVGRRGGRKREDKRQEQGCRRASGAPNAKRRFRRRAQLICCGDVGHWKNVPPAGPTGFAFAYTFPSEPKSIIRTLFVSRASRNRHTRALDAALRVCYIESAPARAVHVRRTCSAKPMSERR
jgi:hypothetical protein